MPKSPNPPKMVPQGTPSQGSKMTTSGQMPPPSHHHLATTCHILTSPQAYCICTCTHPGHPCTCVHTPHMAMYMYMYTCTCHIQPYVHVHTRTYAIYSHIQLYTAMYMHVLPYRTTHLAQPHPPATCTTAYTALHTSQMTPARTHARGHLSHVICHMSHVTHCQPCTCHYAHMHTCTYAIYGVYSCIQHVHMHVHVHVHTCHMHMSHVTLQPCTTHSATIHVHAQPCMCTCTTIHVVQCTISLYNVRIRICTSATMHAHAQPLTTRVQHALATMHNHVYTHLYMHVCTPPKPLHMACVHTLKRGTKTTPVSKPPFQGKTLIFEGVFGPQNDHFWGSK